MMFMLKICAYLCFNVELCFFGERLLILLESLMETLSNE